MSRSGGLKPRAVAGRPSVTKFTHNNCTGISASGRPKAAVKKIHTTWRMKLFFVFQVFNKFFLTDFSCYKSWEHKLTVISFLFLNFSHKHVHIHPQTTFKHPQTTLKHPQTTLKHPQTTFKHPQTTLKHPQTTHKHPQTTFKHPKTTLKHPSTSPMLEEMR